MKNKTLITYRRKKSIASLFLALLLMFSFNSTPIIMLANRQKTTNAYQKTETQTYYSKTSSENESNFADGKYPSSMEAAFSGSSKNFNVYNYYTSKFESFFREHIEELFLDWDGTYNTGSSENTYSAPLTALKNHCNNATTIYEIYEYYTSDSGKTYFNNLKTQYSFDVESFQEFVEFLALYGLPNYNENASLPPFVASFASGTNTTHDQAKNLSVFYRLLRCKITDVNYDSYKTGTPYEDTTDSEGNTVTGEETINNSLENRQAFYTKNTHYLAVKSIITTQIETTAPAYVFDGKTQDTNVAAIFANDAKLSLSYNYSTDYETYTLPNLTSYETATVSDVKKKVYYWGNISNVSSSSDYTALGSNATDVWIIEPIENKVVNALKDFLYRPIQVGEFGYVAGVTTYYKINASFTNTTSGIKALYILNNNPSQSELDTYGSINANVISQTDLDNDIANPIDERYYINIPYETDEVYLKAVYETLLYSRPFTFEEFLNYVTYQDTSSNTQSKVYLKLAASNAKNIVYINADNKTSFNSTYPDYAYKIETFTSDEFIADDYVEITSSSSNSGYLPTGFEESYKLYFKKVKNYYTNGTTSTYQTTGSDKEKYEQEKTIITNLEKDTIAAAAYEMSGTERKLYVFDDGSLLTEGNLPSDLADKGFTSSNVITQDDLDKNPNYYVNALSYSYDTNNIDTKYTLYYKHTDLTGVNKIYVVDDSDNASENKIYKTLNYHVISSSEYKAGSHNYLAVAEGDDNYNSNFLLYYKYERNSIIPSTTTTKKHIYILKDDIANIENYETLLSSYTYSIVESDDVAEYNLIDESSESSIYSDARTAFFGSEAAGSDPAPTLHLYYKATDVFVQNELKGGNAIYVSYSSSLTDSSRTTYSEHFWTPVKNTEITNNPDLYVLLTKDDANYNADYKLYYRYIEADETHNKIYSIDDIDTTASDFDARDYELVKSGMYGYEEYKELYYKKTILSTNDNIITKPAFYYYQTSSTVTLSSNSYYAISFYVYTVGTNARATFIIKDTAGVMDDIVLDNINTASKWQQYYVFISTDISTASTINLYLYLGDEENGIKGDNGDEVTSITGSVFFDDIRINKIGLTDYNKQALNNVPVYSTLYKNNDGDEVAGQYADEYNNRIFIANKETENSTRFTNNNYELKNLITNSTSISDYKNFRWNDMFDFDKASDDLKNILGYYDNSSASTSTSTEGEGSAATDTTVANQLKEKTLDPYYDSTNKRYNLNGYKMYNLYDTDTAITADNDMFPTLWRYYLARSYGYDGTSLKKYLNAYESGDLEVSITNKIEETKKTDDDDDDDDDDTSTDSGDITYISNPFNNNNYALKLKNTNTDSTLGITSNAFMIKQFGYYKITIWIYSPDEEGKASLALNSVMYTGKSNDYGSLLSASISSTYANVAKSTAKTEEYGWSQVTFYVEGNARRDMQCYLVLSADSNSTVYFDNITIEKITSKVYDSNTSSGSYSASLSLTPTDNYDYTGIKNGNFDYVVETNTDLNHNVNSSEPRTADSWTAFSANSSRVTAGVVSTKNQSEFFQKYAGGADNRPYENFGSSLVDDFSNVYAIYAPNLVDSIKEDVTGNKTQINYKHDYSIYSGSFSITTNSFYKITFKFYKTSSFNGTLVSNLYLSSVKDANIFASIKIDSSDISEGWHTYTYYVQTGTSSQTVYLSLGVENATGLCYFKNATMAKDSSGKTYDEVLADVVKKNGIVSTATEDIQNAIKDVRFVDMTDLNLSYHTPTEDETTGLYNQKVFTDNTTTTDKHTSGKSGVVVANYFSSVQTTTYSVTINKVTYYIGEVYKVNINDTDYFVHKTYNAKSNAYEYKLYSDSALTQEVTKIDEKAVKIESISTGIKVTVDSTEIEQDKITTTYRLYKFSDLRDEVTEIDGSEVKVENLNKVVVGTGSKATENNSTSETNTSYLYHFVDKDYEFNNTIIPSSELVNNQSGNVLILANGYSTDYITIKQTTTRTIGKSTYNVLRLYVKTSDFDSEDFGLNIEIAAIDTSWKNINTTKSEYADEYGFVCYEVLISTNSTDSVSDFAVKLSLGNDENLGYGYAIISDISLDSFASKEAFEHYSSLVDDDNETVKKKLYAENESTDSSTTEDEEEADDKNSVSWATFFYIFSSILLVVTMVVAMVALILKKHPIKFAKKYANTHERDIDSVSSKKQQTTPAKVTKAKDAKEIKDRNNSGGII